MNVLSRAVPVSVTASSIAAGATGYLVVVCMKGQIKNICLAAETAEAGTLSGLIGLRQSGDDVFRDFIGSGIFGGQQTVQTMPQEIDVENGQAVLAKILNAGTAAVTDARMTVLIEARE